MIEFLNNPLVLTITTVLLGLAVKFYPSLAKVPNAIIPYLTALIAFFLKLAGGGAAAATTLGWAGVGATPFMLALSHGQASATGVLLATLGASLWQAVTSSLTYEVFLRHPLLAAGWKKAVAIAGAK
ncbi:MAG TPA: hypothetical protein VIV56_07220 [Gemmatimonadales bacterium]